MTFPERKQNRLTEYDYSENGAYFITICTKDRSNILCDTSVGATCGRPQMPLTNTGLIINNELSRLSSIYSNVSVDKYVIMPNHIHMIIMILGGRPKDAPTISRIINQFKGSITKQTGFPVWQKSFYDHIIRDEQEYLEVWKYIDENPLKWQEDCYY